MIDDYDFAVIIFIHYHEAIVLVVLVPALVVVVIVFVVSDDKLMNLPAFIKCCFARNDENTYRKLL